VSYKDRLHERRAQALGEAKAAADLTVTTVPTDAKITVIVSGTPYLLQSGLPTSLPAGPAQITVEKAGFDSDERSLTLEAGPTQITVTLKERTTALGHNGITAIKPHPATEAPPIVNRSKQTVDVREADDHTLEAIELFIRRHKKELGTRKKGISLISRAGWLILHDLIIAEPERALAYFIKAI
jgi:hypothetical protein